MMETIELIQTENFSTFVLPDEYKGYTILDVLANGSLFPHGTWNLLDSKDGIILNCSFEKGAKIEAQVRKD